MGIQWSTHSGPCIKINHSGALTILIAGLHPQRFLLNPKLGSEIRICFKVLCNLTCKPGLRTAQDKYTSFTSAIFVIAIAIAVLFSHFSVGFLGFSYHIDSAVVNILVHPYALVLSIEKAQKRVCCVKVDVDVYILNISSSSQVPFLRKPQ